MDSKTSYSNIPLKIEEKIGLNYHNKKNHPICIMKSRIYKYLTSLPNYNFDIFDKFNPIVSTYENFDALLLDEKHPARAKTDTYYINEKTVLRTHTSAHQNKLLSNGYTSFIVTGDVYRKDDIDRNHFPVFHQMECLSIINDDKEPVAELKKVLSGLVEYLFPKCEYRFNKDYFPFTEPSFEIEIKNSKGEWIEILGCGITHSEILERNGITKKAWAFGLGLERLCMLLFEIPDIRYFWSTDNKFLSQFNEDSLNKFKPYSKLEPIFRDISFWLDNDDVNKHEDDFVWSQHNDFMEAIRDIGNDMIKDVTITSKFFHPKKLKYSYTYRLCFCPLHTITNLAELTKVANNCMDKLYEICDSKFNVVVR